MSFDIVTVALLGAESTGKTQLARAMGDALRAQGSQVHVVGEWLREWCDAEGRTPRPDEQMAIARTQAQRVAEAIHAIEVRQASAPAPASPPAYVIADTTPLMTAVYSDWLFEDAALYPMALAHQAGFSHTLVTGLDLPWVADGLQRDGPQVREPIDALLRAALGRGGVPFKVVYGRGEERLHQALLAIDSVASAAGKPSAKATFSLKNQRPWHWACEKCSDPECEHRLFSRLTGGASPG